MFKQSNLALLRLLLSILLFPALGLAQLALEFDINQKPSGSNPLYFTVYHGDIYFSADDGAFGKELWKRESDTGEIMRISDFSPNENDGSPNNFYLFQDQLFFSARGSHLYIYDETTSTAQQAEGVNITYPGSYTEFEGMLYFSARPSSGNSKLYRYNPNTNSIELVLDLNPDVSNDAVGSLVAVNGVLYFTGNDQINGTQFWSLNTTTFEPTVISGIDGANQAFSYQNKLYFGKEDTENGLGRELFEYDPSTQMQRMVMDLTPGAGDSDPISFILVGDKLVFSAGGFSNRELWAYDGNTDIVTQFEVNPNGAASPYIKNIKDGLLYFLATDGDDNRSFYTYSPTANEINLVFTHDQLNDGVALGDKIYFSGFEETIDQEFFVYDETTTETTLELDINPTTASSSPSAFVPFNGKLYFNARDELTGQELWAYDPVSGTTSIVVDHNPGLGHSNPRYLYEFDDRLFMNINFPDFGDELAYYDPDLNEIIMVVDFNGPFSSGFPENFSTLNGKLYFTARMESVNNTGLFEYDPILDQVTTITEETLRDLYVFNNELYGLYEGDETVGNELYRIDIPTGALTLISDINTGEADAGIDNMISHQGKLFFTARDPINVIKIRSYDPVTNEVTTYLSTNNSSWIVEYDGQLYMAGKQNSTGRELYRFDLATESYEIVTDIVPGSSQSAPVQLTVFNGKLYFNAGTPEHGKELWEYDAATETTQIIADIWPGQPDSNPFYLTLFNDKLYFAADDGNHGTEIWSLASCLNSFLTTEPEHEENQDGSIDLSVVGGTPPYNYSWSTGAITEDIEELSIGEYTVTVTDAAGCISILTGRVELFVSIDDPVLLNDLQLSPNPCQDQLRIDLGQEIATEIMITDLLGRTVLYQNNTNASSSILLDVHLLQTGIYQLAIFTNGQRIAIEQLVVN